MVRPHLYFKFPVCGPIRKRPSRGRPTNNIFVTLQQAVTPEITTNTQNGICAPIGYLARRFCKPTSVQPNSNRFVISKQHFSWSARTLDPHWRTRVPSACCAPEANSEVPRGGIEPPTLLFSGSGFYSKIGYLGECSLSNGSTGINELLWICLTTIRHRKPLHSILMSKALLFILSIVASGALREKTEAEHQNRFIFAH